MRSYPVGKRINQAANDDVEWAKPVEFEIASPGPVVRLRVANEKPTIRVTKWLGDVPVEARLQREVRDSAGRDCRCRLN
jgi:hypothetical protein